MVKAYVKIAVKRKIGSLFFENLILFEWVFNDRNNDKGYNIAEYAL
jgi:hypothetical protein